ncbi:MAG: hypothetical protein J6K50_01030 [Clostridia bacterium]|nr:hypothetical protein [Clostridia bacterium]
MKKKNYTMRIAAGVMTAALLSTCAISSTFAKYTSESTGTATARVAKWDILFGDKTTMSETFTFDLFRTLYDPTANSPEMDVKTGDDVTRIAPGTQGSFAVKITNNSEVTATYEIDYTVTNSASIPVQFSVDNGTSWTDDLTDVAAVTLAMGSSETITIEWKWEFSGDDSTDTGLGEKGTDTLTVSAKVTATQVD